MYKKIILGLMLAVSLTSHSQEVVHNLNGPCDPQDIEVVDNLSGPCGQQDIRKKFGVTVNIIAISLFSLIDMATASINSDIYKSNDQYAIGVYSRFLFALIQYIRTLEPELVSEYDQLVEQL